MIISAFADFFAAPEKNGIKVVKISKFFLPVRVNRYDLVFTIHGFGKRRMEHFREGKDDGANERKKNLKINLVFKFFYFQRIQPENRQRCSNFL